MGLLRRSGRDRRRLRLRRVLAVAAAVAGVAAFRERRLAANQARYNLP